MSGANSWTCTCGHAAAEHQRNTSPLAVPSIKPKPCLIEACDCKAFVSQLAVSQVVGVLAGDKDAA